MKLTGENRSAWEKTCPSATVSTTNPTWIDSGSNPGLRGVIRNFVLLDWPTSPLLPPSNSIHLVAFPILFAQAETLLNYTFCGS
jgi:hypothetical protein